jgi:succinylglutamic semialdehyde dehydrogenase
MEYRGNFIAGRWAKVTTPDETLVRENPCRKSETVFAMPVCVSAVDEAVNAAQKARSHWDRLGIEGRRPYLERFRASLDSRKEQLAHAISTEMGKPLWESRGEAAALTAKIDIMCGEGLDYTRDVHPEGLKGGLFRYRPLGTLAVLGPYNFPLHLANGHIIPGLITGNTIVVKPSELTPGSMQLYFECLEEASFPDGVVNLVQGGGKVGAALAAHRDVQAVLFTGSYETGLRIQQATLTHYWKQLALEMGGKNTSIVLDDADISQAVYEITQAACLTTGQRCSATSRVVVRREIADALIEGLVDTIGRVTCGDALTEDVFMGPLADRRAYDKFMAAQSENENGNLTPLLMGGATREDLDGYFVKPALWRANNADESGPHQGCEIFGPDIIVYTVDSDEEAARVANATEYGLAMSVFTADEARFERIAYDLRTGILNMNRSTVGASSRLPFGGVDKSGNGRPSAILAGLYCTYPQAQLRIDPGFETASLGQAPLKFLLRER